MASRESSCHFSGYPIPKYIVSSLRNAMRRDLRKPRSCDDTLPERGDDISKHLLQARLAAGGK